MAVGSGGPTVFAAVADTESVGSDYKATSLSPSSTWSTNLNTGDFNWSYEMAVPNVPGGLKPNVGLTYSSASVDGRTGNTNNQSSWVGDGFDLSPGFVERRYKPCDDDGVENADGGKPGDLPHTERATAEVLALPIHPGITPAQREEVVGAIAACYAAMPSAARR